MELNAIIQHIRTIPIASETELLHAFSEVLLPKGHILFTPEKAEQHIYFIKSGILRAYYYDDGNEVTFWFGQEGDYAMSIMNYVENRSSYEYIELLEESVLYQISNNKLQELFQKDIQIANWGRKLAEKELLKAEERFISRQFKTATERYLELMQKSPSLLQKVQLGHIASYLGITQVSLSRIRAELRY